MNQDFKNGFVLNSYNTTVWQKIQPILDRNYDQKISRIVEGWNQRRFDFWLMQDEVSNFRLRKFAQVEPFCEPLGWRVDINNVNSLDNSGSNETMQKVLASIV